MTGRRTLLALGTVALVAACGGGTTAGGPLAADDAVVCREIGGGLVHIRYETAEGPAVRTQHGIDHDRAQGAGGVSEQAARTLTTLGWSEEALAELERPQRLSPEVEALLDDMPSCLEELREQG